MVLSLFNLTWYLDHNPDVAEAVSQGLIDAFNHFEQFGKAEGRSAGPLFNAQEYLANNPDVAEAVARGEITAYDHFIANGAGEGRSPISLFDQEFYLNQNPDVAAAMQSGVMSAVEHFLLFGQSEPRAFNPAIDLGDYLAANPDVAAAVESGFMTGMEHLMLYGTGEGRYLGNGISLSAFSQDPVFQQELASGDIEAALNRVSDVAPFLPEFEPPANWAPPANTPIPIDFVPVAGTTLIIPEGVEIPEGTDLPDTFEPGAIVPDDDAGDDDAGDDGGGGGGGGGAPAPTFTVSEDGGVVTFGGTATGDISISWAGATNSSEATFTRGGITATTKPFIGGKNKITLAADQTLAATAANVTGVKIDGEGNVAVTALEDTANADLSGLAATTVTAAVDTDGGVTFTGNLGTAVVTLSSSDSSNDDDLTVTAAIADDTTFVSADPNVNLIVTGSDGDQTITGTAQGDVITGGDGADDMTGGDGADTFVYFAAGQGNAAGAVVVANADTINGTFNGATDKIAISYDNANSFLEDLGNGDTAMDAAVVAQGSLNADNDVNIAATASSGDDFSDTAQVITAMGSAIANSTAGDQTLIAVKNFAGTEYGLYHFVEDGTVTANVQAAELTLMGVITTGALVAGDFSAIEISQKIITADQGFDTTDGNNIVSNAKASALNDTIEIAAASHLDSTSVVDGVGGTNIVSLTQNTDYDLTWGDTFRNVNTLNWSDNIRVTIDTTVLGAFGTITGAGGPGDALVLGEDAHFDFSGVALTGVETIDASPLSTDGRTITADAADFADVTTITCSGGLDNLVFSDLTFTAATDDDNSDNKIGTYGGGADATAVDAASEWMFVDSTNDFTYWDGDSAETIKLAGVSSITADGTGSLVLITDVA